MQLFRTLIVVLVTFQLAGCNSSQRVQDLHAAHVHSFDDSKIVFDSVGSGEPTLVFIHGWCCNRGQWENQVAEFSGTNRVVTIDLAGHGESSDTRAAWTIEDFARDVEAVVTQLDLDQVILVGHSMGGPVSLMAAKNMPDRVIGVIGVDTLHDAEFKFPPEMIEQFAASFERDFEGTMDGFFGMMYPPGTPADPAVVERLRREALNNDPKMAADLMRGFGDLDSQRHFAECPVAIHCINAATPNPTFVERNRKYNRRFHVVLMENVGHWPQIEKPVEFNKRLREQVDAIVTNRGM